MLVNWSRTQGDDLQRQLDAGFRYFDLRIADCDVFNDTFFWWHGITADTIFEGLEQIATFAASFPEEVIILEFQYFVEPAERGTQPMREERMDVLADVMLSYLAPVLVNQTLVSRNPTVNEVLATGANVIATFRGIDYMEQKTELFWDYFIEYRYSQAGNPEDLFVSRSGQLQELSGFPNSVTMVSGCVTPDEKIVIAGLVRACPQSP